MSIPSHSVRKRTTLSDSVKTDLKDLGSALLGRVDQALSQRPTRSAGSNRSSDPFKLLVVAVATTAASFFVPLTSLVLTAAYEVTCFLSSKRWKVLDLSLGIASTTEFFRELFRLLILSRAQGVVAAKLHLISAVGCMAVATYFFLRGTPPREAGAARAEAIAPDLGRRAKALHQA